MKSRNGESGSGIREMKFKETNLNTDFHFHKYYFYINKLKGKYACVSCYSVNVHKYPSIGVLQKKVSCENTVKLQEITHAEV